MHRTVQEIIGEIRDAFQGVKLGMGIGLFEGRALDDHADDATRQSVREKDERDRWESLPRERLESYNDALSFLDPKGMCFHLPAFMLAELEGAQVSCISHLVELDDWRKSKLALLSGRQRQSVREFLLFLVDEADYIRRRREIRKALTEYWKSDDS